MLSPGRREWLPAVLVPALVAAGALVAGAQQARTVDLPERSAEQVLALVAGSDVRALSGTVQQTSDLGLPELPAGATGPTGAMALDLLTGSHTLRVFLDGPQRARLQVLDTLAERDVVRDGRDVWLYDSERDEATHLVLPAEPPEANDGAADDHAGPPSLDGQPLTPESLARHMLSMATPSTEVSVGADTRVAGRTAYELLLSPQATATLVDEVAIAVDSETGLPLRVRVAARGDQEPAFEIGYTDLTLQRPDADLFRFTPPAGATVRERAVTMLPGPPTWSYLGPDTKAGLPHPVVTGTGWDAVVELPAGSVPAALQYSPVLRQATRAVPEGRALTTALVTVLITDDGRVLAGAVPVERLQAVATDR